MFSFVFQKNVSLELRSCNNRFYLFFYAVWAIKFDNSITGWTVVQALC